MKQEWVCEVCGLSGAAEYQTSDGVFAVVHSIENHHDRLAKLQAPHCHFDVHKVRVRNPELMDIYAWNRMVSSIQEARRGA